jgi:drug/metabolite transporter (DMT)-like permease
MPPPALGLVLVAAVLHVGWNALAKRARHSLCFLWAAQALSALGLLPFALARLQAEGLPAVSLPFVAATATLHTVYFYALGRSYAAGALSVVYPIARGLGVALVPVFALAALDERPSPLGALGIGLVVAGILALHAVALGWERLRSGLVAGGAGTGWAVATGLTIAVYSLVDKAGVGHLHPVPYVTLMGLGVTALLWPAVRASGALGTEWAANRRPILLAATMTLTAYLLVLFAFRLSKASYVVAAREVSIVLSAVVGSVWLKEGTLAPRALAAAVVLAGVACVALAR